MDSDKSRQKLKEVAGKKYKVIKEEVNPVGTQEIQSDSDNVLKSCSSHDSSTDFSLAIKIQDAVEEMSALIENKPTTVQDNEQLQKILRGYLQLLNQLQDKSKKCKQKEIKGGQKYITMLIEELRNRQLQVDLDTAIDDRSKQNNITTIDLNVETNKDKNPAIGQQLKRFLKISWIFENQQKQEDREKCLHNVKNMTQEVISITKDLNNLNVEANNEPFNNYKRKLNSLEEINQEANLKKSKVNDVMASTEEAFANIEIDQKLKQAEHQHYQCIVDLNITDVKSCEKKKQELLQLKDYVARLSEINQESDDKKKYLLCNIVNSLALLDQKSVIKTTCNQTLIDNLASCCSEFQKSFSSNCSVNELKNFLMQINEVTILMEQNLIKIENQIQNYDPDFHLSSVRPKINHVPPVKNQMDNICKDLETLYLWMEQSVYTKQKQSYRDVKRKLEDYKVKLRDLSRQCEENGNFAIGIARNVDDLLRLLDDSATDDEQKFTKKFVELKKKVSEYSGTYKSDSYVAIEKDLNASLNIVDDVFKDNNGALAMKKDIKKNMRILEEKSYKDKEVDVHDIERKTLITIRENVECVKRELTNQNPLSKNESEKLNNTLTHYMLTLDNLKGDQVKEERKQIYKDIDVCSARIQKRKVASTSQSSKQQNVPKTTAAHGKAKGKRVVNSKKLTEVTKNIETVKTKLNHLNPLTNEELIKLENILTQSVSILDYNKDDQLKGARKKIYEDINYCGAAIKERKNKQEQPNQLNQQELELQIMTTIEAKLQEIKPEVEVFVGLESSRKFFELDETLIRSTLKLDDIRPDRGSDLHNNKIRLLKEIYKYTDMLDERVRQTKKIEQLETEVREISTKVEAFKGHFQDPQYTSLNEELVKIEASLGEFDANQELVARKEDCIKEIDACKNKLKIVRSGNSHELSVN